MIDTTRMRAALVNGYMYVGGTYDAALEYEHYEGAILALCDEVDRLRAETAKTKANEPPAMVDCWRCDGRGEYAVHGISKVWMETCKICNGTGKVTK